MTEPIFTLQLSLILFSNVNLLSNHQRCFKNWVLVTICLHSIPVLIKVESILSKISKITRLLFRCKFSEHKLLWKWNVHYKKKIPNLIHQITEDGKKENIVLIPTLWIYLVDFFYTMWHTCICSINKAKTSWQATTMFHD